jgi:phosphoribosylanthranilate isomerase
MESGMIRSPLKRPVQPIPYRTRPQALKIKICGLFRDEDIDYVNEAGPDFIGFVFAKSKRQVSAETAAKLRDSLREGIVPVGVFVNAPVEEVAALYRDGVIAIAQLHGEESPEYIGELKGRCGAPVIKAVRVESREDIVRAASCGADYLLLDHGSGGTGRRFDWSLLGDEKYLGALSIPCFLAGGIDVHNIEEALSYRPFAVDVSSGAETGSVKDREKILRLVEQVRKYE